MRRYIETTPIKQFDVWFAPHPKQGTLWPSEIVLTDDYFYSLKDHAIPFDFRALKAIQQKPRAQDIYLWMTQRLCRIETGKPLLIRWQELHEMFGGQTPPKEFKHKFLCFARKVCRFAMKGLPKRRHERFYQHGEDPSPVPLPARTVSNSTIQYKTTGQ